MTPKLTGEKEPEYYDCHVPVSRLRLSETNGRDYEPPEKKRRIFQEDGLIHPPVVWYNDETGTMDVEDGWQRCKLVREAGYNHVPCKVVDDSQEAMKFVDEVEEGVDQTTFTKMTRYSGAVNRYKRRHGEDVSDAEAIRNEIPDGMDISQIRTYVQASKLPEPVKELLKKGVGTGGAESEHPEPRDEKYMEEIDKHATKNLREKGYQSNGTKGLKLSLKSAAYLVSKSQQIPDPSVRERRVIEIAAEICTVSNTQKQKAIIRDACKDAGKPVNDIVMSHLQTEYSGHLGFRSGVFFPELSDVEDDINNWIDAVSERSFKDFLIRASEREVLRMRCSDRGTFKTVLRQKLEDDELSEAFFDYCVENRLDPDEAEFELLREALTESQDSDEMEETPTTGTDVAKRQAHYPPGMVAELEDYDSH